MSEGNRELTELLGDLAGAIEELQTELDPARGPPRPPSPRQLARFTSEVTIPAIILVLETNVRALRLVQRALRIADGRETDGSSSGARERATAVGRATVQRLDDALTDLQDALEGRPPDDEARQLLQQVQDLRADIEAELEPSARGDDADDATGGAVDVDVEQELRSLKDDVDEGDDAPSEGGGE